MNFRQVVKTHILSEMQINKEFKAKRKPGQNKKINPGTGILRHQTYITWPTVVGTWREPCHAW